MANLTRRQYADVKKSIETLQVRIEEVEERLKSALAQGDLKENNEVDQATLDLRIAKDQLAEKRRLLDEAVISDKANTTVVVVIDGVKYTKTIAPAGVGEYGETVTDDSIIGNILKTAEVGDVIEYSDAIGMPHKLSILKKI